MGSSSVASRSMSRALRSMSFRHVSVFQRAELGRFFPATYRRRQVPVVKVLYDLFAAAVPNVGIQ